MTVQAQYWLTCNSERCPSTSPKVTGSKHDAWLAARAAGWWRHARVIGGHVCPSCIAAGTDHSRRARGLPT